MSLVAVRGPPRHASVGDQPGFYGRAFSGPFFVLRHDPPADPPVVKGVTGRFIDVGIEDAVAIAKEAAGGADVGVLGASIGRQRLEAGLLDEVVVHVAPVLLGDGVRVFDSPDAPAVGLHLVSVARDGDLEALRYTL